MVVVMVLLILAVGVVGLRRPRWLLLLLLGSVLGGLGGTSASCGARGGSDGGGSSVGRLIVGSGGEFGPLAGAFASRVRYVGNFIDGFSLARFQAKLFAHAGFGGVLPDKTPATRLVVLLPGQAARLVTGTLDFSSTASPSPGGLVVVVSFPRLETDDQTAGEVGERMAHGTGCFGRRI